MPADARIDRRGVNGYAGAPMGGIRRSGIGRESA